MKKVNLLFQYVSYKLFSPHAGGHGIHSPFVFSIVENVLKNKSGDGNIDLIEEYRIKMLKIKDKIGVSSFGAGSGYGKSDQRRIGNIIKNSCIKPKYGKMLYRLVKNFSPGYVIELGTSAGISTLYLAAADPSARVITIEGDKNLAEIAENGFNKNRLENVTLVCDEFSNALPKILENINTEFVAFIDGDHRKEKLLAYFEILLTKATPNCIFIIDDIRWSAGMEEAWNNLIEDSRVKISIDLFNMGILFFKENMGKQHFVIKF